MPLTDWNWKEVKGRRSKRRPHPQLNDSEDEEEQENPSPEECSPAVASEPSRPKAVATGARSDSLIWLWRTREFFFKNPPQWEILVENTFIDVRSWHNRSSRTVSAPARLITSGGSTSSTARPPPRLPANFPAAPTGSPPAPPEKASAVLLAAAPEPDAPPIKQDVLGCMTLVKKRRGRNKFPDEIHIKTRNSQGASGASAFDTDFHLESSVDFVGAPLMQEEEDEILYVDDAEEESTIDGIGSLDTLHTNDASDATLTKSEFAEDPNSPPVSHCGDSKPSEESAEEDKEEADQASTTASPGPQSSKARRRARKRALIKAAKASEAAGNPQDVDAPSPKTAAPKKSKPVAVAAPRMPPLVTTILKESAAKGSAVRLSRERYSDEGFARTAWPSRRPVRDHGWWGQQQDVPLSLEVTTPSCGSFSPTRRPVEFFVDEEEELPELEPKDGAARLEELQRRLADVQLILQKATKDVKAQELRNIATDHRILREMESAVRQAEMAVLREEEDLEKERRKQRAKPPARIPSSPMAAGEFPIRDGMRSRAAEEASPCGDSSDAVALVSRTLARERALAGLAGGPSPELQVMAERGLPSSRPQQAGHSAILSRSLMASM